MSRKNKLENGIERLFSSSKPAPVNNEPAAPSLTETPSMETALPVEPTPVNQKPPAAAKPPRPRAKSTAAKQAEPNPTPQPSVEKIEEPQPLIVESPADTQGSLTTIAEPAPESISAPEMLLEVNAEPENLEPATPVAEIQQASAEAVQQAVEEKAAALVGELQYETDEHLVIFRLNDQIYGVSIMVVDGIIKTQTITPVPRAPFSIVGVTNLRGIVLPVINMHQRLCLEELENSQHARIIIINKTDVSAGLMVDEVLAVAKIDAKSITPPSPVINKAQTQFIKGIAKFDNRLVILLDLDKIFESIAARTNTECFKRVEKV